MLLRKKSYFVILFILLPFWGYLQEIRLQGGKVIKPGAVVARGLFNVYSSEGRYYLELHDTILTRPIMVVSRILQSSTALEKQDGDYGGDLLGEADITFNRLNNKINLSNVVFADRSRDSSGNGLLKGLRKNNLPGIELSFDIQGYGPDSSYIIDVTDFLTGNHKMMTGKKSTQGFQPDKSFVEAIRSYPLNMEVRTFKTYSSGHGDTSTTIRINTSFVLLPKVPMRDRFLDPRIGYFTPYNFDFDKDPQQAKMVLKISRWRLEPAPEDEERYKRGELVEPVKPIIFYIDPATPRQWVPYLKMGVQDWQAAFEKAGFKNAIQAREVNPTDTAWSINDARYSVIVYKPSFLANAAGPTIIDPRSGEILESHVSWFHNVMTLLHNWYMLQAGLSDPAAQNQQFSTELMGQLIRFVSSHEIGHTLGLKHNFGSSSTVPVDSLRNKQWVEKNGHTPSIMDYARFNYVAQPEDRISRSGIFPRIGDYDKWAIEWGYRYFPDKTMEEEGKSLFTMLTDSLRMNPRLYYGEQSLFGIVDPRCQNEDLSADVITANTYGLKNLKRITQLLPEWTSGSTDQFGTRSGNGLKRTYSALLSQFFTYQMHIVNCIGMSYYNNVTTGDTAKIYMPVPKEIQRRAMDFLNREVFNNEPRWLAPEKITTMVWDPSVGVLTNLIATDLLNALLVPQKLINLYNASLVYRDKTYTPDDLLTQLETALWQNLKTPVAVNSYYRTLQQTYVAQMISLLANVKNYELAATVRVHLGKLKKRVSSIAPLVNDVTTQCHYRDLLIQLSGVSL
jgi:hypothetical protein